MSSAKEQMYAAEYQRRRQTHWRIKAPSLLLVVVAVCLLLAKLAPTWVCGVIFGIGLVGHSLSSRISKYAYCPRCDFSVSPGEGWFPEPTKCRVCNLNLNPQGTR